MNARYATATLLVGAAALAGCKTKVPEDVVAPGVAVSQPETRVPTAPAGPAVGTQEHFVRAVNGQNVIYFDTDRYNIDSADAAALQTQAQYLGQYANISITLEGHADERGTREYNIALGARRATTVRNFLAQNGIAAARMRTISYGKERPVAVCDDISCWSQNRRAQTVLNARVGSR